MGTVPDIEPLDPHSFRYLGHHPFRQMKRRPKDGGLRQDPTIARPKPMQGSEYPGMPPPKSRSASPDPTHQHPFVALYFGYDSREYIEDPRRKRQREHAEGSMYTTQAGEMISQPARQERFGGDSAGAPILRRTSSSRRHSACGAPNKNLQCSIACPFMLPSPLP